MAFFRSVGRNQFRVCLSSLGAVLLLVAAVRAQVVEPKNFLARARACLEAGQDELALSYARRAVAANASNAEAYLILGILLERRSDREGAVAALARAALLAPESELARGRLERALKPGYPSGIDEALIRALPGQVAFVELLFTDRRLGNGPLPTRRWATLRAPGGAREATEMDPRYRRPFPRAVYTYARDERTARWYRVATVRFQKEADAMTATRAAALLGQLFWARREYWSAVPDFPRPPEAHVWLSREGKAGGEEWRGEIYLYEAGRDRTPDEWDRQVTHEYGHLALPAAPIYTAPEPKPNGYLGERLLVEWLWRNGARVWDGRVDLGRYVARRVTPLRQRFLAGGPRSPILRQRDAAGMEQFIGMVLAWEALHGHRLLRTAYERMLGQNAESFLIGCQEAIEALRPPRFEVAPEALLPTDRLRETAGAAAWIYLPTGRWSLRIEGAPALSVRWGTQRLARGSGQGQEPLFTILVSQPDWRRLELPSGCDRVRRLEFAGGPTP